MYGYGSYHAFPILTVGGRICSGEQQLACRWAPLPNFTTWRWSIPNTCNCFKSDVFPILISLTHILTSLNRTLESCTWEILIFCLGQRYFCILTDNSKHPVSYSIAILYILPDSPSTKLYWWTAPTIVHWRTTSQFPSPLSNNW